MMFLTVNLTSWADRWFLAGISVATVFAILIILVFVLAIFSFVATKAANKGKAVQSAQAKPATAAVPVSEASADDMAAVATALYLYMNNSHDEESGVLTITQGNSSWGSVLNPRL